MLTLAELQSKEQPVGDVPWSPNALLGFVLLPPPPSLYEELLAYVIRGSLSSRMLCEAPGNP